MNRKHLAMRLQTHMTLRRMQRRKGPFQPVFDEKAIGSSWNTMKIWCVVSTKVLVYLIETTHPTPRLD